MSKSSSKTIGITFGDPAGIGPEVLAKALRQSPVTNIKNLLLIGDGFVLKKYTKSFAPGCRIWDTKSLAPADFKPGKPSKYTAKASLTYLDTAIELIKKKKIHALVTGPLSKEGISVYRPRFTGHTEYLAQKFNVKDVGMMFVAGGMKTIIVTRHLPLKSVPRLITQKSVLQTLRLTHHSLKKMFRLRTPRLGVCGLNPHAGEGGMLGSEEIERIIPAIKQAQKEGIRAFGPFAADTLYAPFNAKRFDCIIAMYHDQGLAPIKTLYLNELVNLTIGLPFVRTCPAHGTAFDIAGQNKAACGSMAAAITLAHQLL